jgi:hypothetical protein
MTKFAFFLIISLGGLLLTACGGEVTAYAPVPLAVQSEGLADMMLSSNDEIVSLSLQIEVENHSLGLYEPAEGSFLGAYIERDATVAGIRDFEAGIGVNHAIFVYTMALGDDYPIRWVLENMAAMKTPFIIVSPPKEGGIAYDIYMLTDFAREAGRFNVPLFVNLFPIVEGHNFVPTEYIAFFGRARDIFAEYAPNVALVWGFDARSMASSTQFYPGGEAVDWIHLIIYNDVDIYGGFGDFFAYIDYFYFTFQQEGPLVVSTAVSHYTLESNSYFTREAAAKIEYIYDRLQGYQRIRAILYRNYNDLRGSGNKYAVNSAADISEAYARATAASHFLGCPVSSRELSDTATIRIHSPFRAIMRNSYFYIPVRGLMYYARFAYMEQLEGREIEIEGELFFTIADVNRVSGMDFFVDMQRGVLVLR